ncbi:DUF6904 family protein [Fictibacillus macauensis]|uniref:DUF6904 family protein n=1 Tax=Fictibacillus macauensis TaxID=245160 RepID=UPI003B75C5D1
MHNQKVRGIPIILIDRTPNDAKISDDFHNLDTLYNALHAIVGTEDDFNDFEGARLRVLGVCYDIRHALLRHREVKFVKNGLDADMKRFLSIVTNGNSSYFSFEALWSECYLS